MNKSYDCNMNLCVVLLSICALALGLGGNYNIMNGTEVEIEDFPYQISLRKWGLHCCGGVILSNDTILTAAHCVYGKKPTSYSIQAGSKYISKGEVYKISTFNIHPDYNNSRRFKFSNDVAIIKLAKPLNFSDQIQPIELQPEDTPVPVGTTATVSGWGATKKFFVSKVLRAVEMEVISNEECKEIYGTFYEITDNNICLLTPNQGPCFRDAGGPLVANGTLIGTISGGLDCGSEYYPSVFSNIINLRNFIDQYL